MSKILEQYAALKEHGYKTRLLSSVEMLLEWDQETYMPKGGIDFRSKQIELISSIVHKEKTSLSFKKKLSDLIDLKTGEILAPELDERKKASLKEWRREFLIETKLPNDFVKSFAKAISKTTNVWSYEKTNNTCKEFLPHLEEIINLTKKKTEFIGYKDHPYDALLDLYEPGMTTKKLDALFLQLKPFLIDLTSQVSVKEPIDQTFFDAHYPQEKQEEFNHYLLKHIGVDSSFLRLDYTEHPFCLGFQPQDVRITTHFDSNFFRSISAVLHEGGHALYELNLPVEDLGSPLAEYCSMGIHESQSRWWETFIGQGRPFLKFIFPKLKKFFPDQLRSVDFEQFYKAINTVKPSFIRIFSDEVTYNLHIILRYEIEKKFFEEDFAVSNLPEIWNEKMASTFGLKPTTYAEGFLQDIHWACGLIGYFPTYALGNLYSGQLFQTFKKQFPEWNKRVAQGDLGSIKQFLFDNVHQFGRQFPALGLIEQATGSTLSANPYMSYLESKYLLNEN